MENIDLEKIKSDSKEYYRTLESIVCPALNETITFKSVGFNHIIYQKANHERERSSQVLRFKLLPLAVKLIGLSTTYQEYEKIIQKLTIERHGVKIHQNKRVIFWGLIAIINNRKIKVILRKVGNGDIHFWSIIPSWTTNKTRDGKLFSTMKGNPDID